MPSLPSSPETPSRHSRRRKPSNLDLDFSSSASHSAFSNGFISPGHSPQTPRSSLHSPVTPRQKHRASLSLSSDIHDSGGRSVQTGGGGLGSLADELADAWDEDGDEGDEGASLTQTDSLLSRPDQPFVMNDIHDFGIGAMGLTTTSDSLQRVVSEENGLSPQRPAARRKPRKPHHRRSESRYDGSDYGNDSDLEDTGGIPPSLEARMANIEALARRGTEANGSELDGVVDRTAERLKDLGGQSSIENAATRLMTAHASLTSNLTHQSRTLSTLTHPLLYTTSISPLTLLPPPTLEDLITSITHLLSDSLLPYPPTPSPLPTLTALIHQTQDLIHTLRQLSDTLHESRQTASTATRRLKAAKELVAEIRREEDSVAESVAWIERGKWDERLQSRRCKGVCEDVLGGFERECGVWRERLVASAGVVGGD